MKLKILFVPLMIVLVIYLIIWVVVPVYSDPDGIGAARNNLLLAENKLNDINSKGENAAKLVNDLSYTSDQQKILFQYLPNTKKDEEVIESLNSIASANGLFIFSLSMEDVKDNQPVNPAMNVNNNGSIAVPGLDGSNAIAPTESSAKNFNVKIALAGDYEKIKKFIVTLSTLRRFNDVSSLAITRGSATDGTLQANMTIEFNYLKEINSVANVDNKIFADGKFDMSVAGEITNKTNVDISKIDIGALGKTNPFTN